MKAIIIIKGIEGIVDLNSPSRREKIERENGFPSFLSSSDFRRIYNEEYYYSPVSVLAETEIKILSPVVEEYRDSFNRS